VFIELIFNASYEEVLDCGHSIEGSLLSVLEELTVQGGRPTNECTVIVSPRTVGRACRGFEGLTSSWTVGGRDSENALSLVLKDYQDWKISERVL
jgi:hypothetical protein